MTSSGKDIETRNILCLVKLGSIIIICIILINSSTNSQLLYVNIAESLIFLLKLFLALVLSIGYYIWSYVLFERINQKYTNIINILESIVFLLLFMAFIWITGKNQSHFKIIFMFIIIPVSIQFHKYGLISACISSLYLMLLDLLMAPIRSINTNLENDIIISSIFIVIAWLLSFYVKIEQQHSQMLEYKANTDVLTGLNNHRYFYDKMQSFYSDKNTPKNLSLMFLDIDYFKEYNDMFGHLKGDIVLKLIGSKLREIISDEEITIARYGGDEFAIIIPEKTKKQVYDIGEQIRTAIEKMNFEGQEHLTSKNLTVSIGIAIKDKHTNGYIDLIKNADDALYKAKFTKKNQVEIFSSIYNIINTNMNEEHFDLISSIKTLICVINAKDKYTFGHVERVVHYVKMLSDKLELNEQDKETLIYSAYIHDIGKINVPEYILNKKMPLTDDEWNLIKQHPNIGVEIINKIESISSVIPVVMHHHERFDGTGYPDKLKGDKIPYLARILTIADCFDAMTFSRPYKHAMTYDEAIMELKRCSKKQFDPFVTKSFIEIIKDLNNNDTNIAF